MINSAPVISAALLFDRAPEDRGQFGRSVGPGNAAVAAVAQLVHNAGNINLGGTKSNSAGNGGTGGTGGVV